MHLSWGDVAIDDRSAATMEKFHLPISKCDQFGTGADMLMGRLGCQLCPMAAILAYIKARDDHPSAFFVDNSRMPITKSKSMAKVQDALRSTGYPEEQFAGHSFRIGAATTMAMAGIEDSTIQILSHWHSAAFLRYIRTPHDRLATITASLVKSNPQLRALVTPLALRGHISLCSEPCHGTCSYMITNIYIHVYQVVLHM